MARTNVYNCLSEEVLLWYFLVRGMIGERLVKLLFADLVLLETLSYFINQLCGPKTRPKISRRSDCWTASQGFLNSLTVSGVDSVAALSSFLYPWFLHWERLVKVTKAF